MHRFDCSGIKNGVSDDAMDRERGFVLITSLVLISILAILGVGATYKTLVETKVSKLSADSAKALQVANTGINQLFWYWVNTPSAGNAGYDELLQLKDDIANDTNNSGIYIDTLTGGSIAELDAAANGSLDSYIKNSGSIRVYQYQYNNGVPVGIQQVNNSNWKTGTVPQVAVWATSYQVPATPESFPYASPNTVGCENCNIAVYAVGRVGDSRRVIRQTQGFAKQELDGVSALTNAPNGYTWAEMCGGASNPPNNSGWSGNNSGADTLVEATQADYALGSTPSGRAMLSNSFAGTNSGQGSINSAAQNSTLLTMGASPLIAYAGHGAGTSVSRLRVNFADMTMDTNGSSLPSGKLPTDLIRDQLLGQSGELVFFTDPAKHLFQMDAYRWAAEQFTCQDENDMTHSGNGAYCARAKALRDLVQPGSTRPISGRISLADFEYNVANGIPMFGMVRVMYPTEATNKSTTCNGQSVTYYQLPANATQIASGNGQFTQYGNNAKLIVYGSIFFDYFADSDGDYYFDADTEHLLSAPEARKVNLPINVPVMINPAMPRAATGAIPTVAATNASVGSVNNLTTANQVNNNSATSDAALASPYDGWFLASEGLVNPASTTDSDGSMALMATDSSGLVGAAAEIRTNGGGIGNIAKALFTSFSSRLFYYYRMMYASLDANNANVWPATNLTGADFPGGLGSFDFAMGADDSNDGSNDGDKFHLLAPSGYMHGWKVALAALNITADEWNNLLSGNGGTSIATLAQNFNTPVGYGDASYPKGAPMSNSDLPSGYSDQQAWATVLQGDQQKYFKISKDSTNGYGVLDSAFADLPALSFSGGVASFQTYNNIGGIVYMPGALQWQNGKANGNLGYVNGSVITGMGVNNTNSGGGNGAGHVVFVFDPTAVDNANMRQATLVMRRHAWEELY
jgi:type II secretory pathway pseudopilin PulG